MAWELQSHMVGRVVPSVYHYLAAEEDPEAEAARIRGYQLGNDDEDQDDLDAAAGAADREVRDLGWRSGR